MLLEQYCAICGTMDGTFYPIGEEGAGLLECDECHTAGDLAMEDLKQRINRTLDEILANKGSYTLSEYISRLRRVMYDKIIYRDREQRI